MADALSILPDSVVAGESISVSVPSTTVTGYTLSYSFSASTPITVACVASGTTAWTLTVTAAQTLVWKRGQVRFAGMLTNTSTGVVTCIDSGVITVEASPLATSQYTAFVTAIDAAILTFGSNPNKRVALGAMSVEYKTLDDLLGLRAWAQSMANSETGNTTAGGGGFNRIYTRFN